MDLLQKGDTGGIDDEAAAEEEEKEVEEVEEEENARRKSSVLDLGLIHGDCITVTGKTVKENLENIEDNGKENDVVRKIDNPISSTGGLVILHGNLAPDGAVLKVAGHNYGKKWSGPANVFNQEEECMEALKKKQIKPGDFVVIRY